jgi:aldehyde:ferredoxin oxidoreductase
MFKAVVDGAGLCNFGVNAGVDRAAIFEYLNAATGWDKTPDEYMEIGRRVQHLRQAFNVREGLEPASVRIHPLVSGEIPAQSGPAKGISFDLYAMRREYWEAMGWDVQTGHPPEVVLVEPTPSHDYSG